MLLVGPFDYYLTDINSNIIQSVIGEVSNVYTFVNVSSGFYRVNINNTNLCNSLVLTLLIQFMFIQILEEVLVIMEILVIVVRMERV